MVVMSRLAGKEKSVEGDFPKSQKKSQAECEAPWLCWPDWYIDQSLRCGVKCPTHGDLAT